MSKMIIKLKMPEKAPFECPICAKPFTTEKGLGSHKKVHMEKKKKRSHETMELQIEENGDKKTLVARCPVCPQSFASEKALHGHMRKHPDRGWRGMKPPVEAEAVSPALSSGQSSKLAMGENSSLTINDGKGKGDSNKTNFEEEKKYVCDKCGMVFRSYQALGGHKSHHGCEDDNSASLYMKQPEGNAVVAEEGPSSSPVFEFDLNELPPERDD